MVELPLPPFVDDFSLDVEAGRMEMLCEGDCTGEPAIDIAEDKAIDLSGDVNSSPLPPPTRASLLSIFSFSSTLGTNIVSSRKGSRPIEIPRSAAALPLAAPCRC